MASFGGDFTRSKSQLDVLIERAVDPYKVEPDYAAHISVANYIKEKKANAPHDAAKTIVRFVNNRNPHISLLALALLDTVTSEVGYSMHLQVATKWFLNELVRRFPERPPPFPGPVMAKIIEMIHSWNEGICVTSKYKEDLVNIRDMHRLLTFKGYRFRSTNRTQMDTVVASTSNLKSAEELEQEDREVQSAKLQELIRRGTPRDLAAAQELMKALAGAEPEKKPDYRSQSLNELNKLEQKVILLNEMLDNVDTERGEKFASGDVYDQVANILESARPKIQKWISDAETGDPEMLDIFLQMNDQINSVLNRYESYKKGDYVAAANPVPTELAGSSRTNETSLIEFDDPAPAVQLPGNAPLDDLEGLFGGGTPSAVVPTTSVHTQLSPSSRLAQLSQHPSHTFSQPQPQPFSNANMAGGMVGYNNLSGMFNSPSSSSPVSNGSGASPFGSIMLPGTPQPKSSSTSPLPQVGGASQPSWGWNNGTAQASNMTTMGSTSTSMQPAQSQQQTTQAGQNKDPFSDLVGLF